VVASCKGKVTTTEFSTKINLPYLCEKLGCASGLEFKKIPKVGWIAWDARSQRTLTVFDLFHGQSSIEMAYKFCTVENSLQKLIASHTRWLALQHVHRAAKKEIDADVIFRPPGGERVKVKKWAEDAGFSIFMENNQLGLLTDKVLSQMEQSQLTKVLGIKEPAKLKNMFVLPSFVGPSLIGSLRLVPALPNLEILEWKSTVEGWFGTLGKPIQETVLNTVSEEGCTWCDVLPYWVDTPVDLSSNLRPETLIKIWTATPKLPTIISPVDMLVRLGYSSKLKELVSSLTLKQAEELEKLTGESVIADWNKYKAAVAEVAGIEFTTDGTRYFITRNNEVVEYTNFAIKLVKIVKTKEGYIQLGCVRYKDREVEFALPRKSFQSYSGIMNSLHSLFLDTQLGVPMVAPGYKQYLTNVIHEFNPNIPIEDELVAKNNLTKGGTP
jgi:hypothetical protein